MYCGSQGTRKENSPKIEKRGESSSVGRNRKKKTRKERFAEKEGREENGGSVLLFGVKGKWKPGKKRTISGERKPNPQN